MEGRCPHAAGIVGELAPGKVFECDQDASLEMGRHLRVVSHIVVSELKFDERGLLPAIAQDHLTGEVRMVAWMNREAVRLTLETGWATFYSRSRSKLWMKGETSGHRLRVHSVTADCDGDTLLLGVSAEGPSCHTGARNCFFNPVDRSTSIDETANPLPVLPVLAELERTIERRRSSSAEKSYTKSLLDGGVSRISGKITEESKELVEALENESSARVASEAADVIFHLLVGLRSRDVPFSEVIEVLRQRMGVSGHVEKASRGQRPSNP